MTNKGPRPGSLASRYHRHINANETVRAPTTFKRHRTPTSTKRRAVRATRQQPALPLDAAIRSRCRRIGHHPLLPSGCPKGTVGRIPSTGCGRMRLSRCCGCRASADTSAPKRFSSKSADPGSTVSRTVAVKTEPDPKVVSTIRAPPFHNLSRCPQRWSAASGRPRPAPSAPRTSGEKRVEYAGQDVFRNTGPLVGHDHRDFLTTQMRRHQAQPRLVTRLITGLQTHPHRVTGVGHQVDDRLTEVASLSRAERKHTTNAPDRSPSRIASQSAPASTHCLPCPGR